MKTGYGPRQTRLWRNLARSTKVTAGGRCAYCGLVVGVENLELGGSHRRVATLRH